MASETFSCALGGISLEQDVPPNASFQAKVRGYVAENPHEGPDANALRQSLHYNTCSGSETVGADVNIEMGPAYVRGFH